MLVDEWLQGQGSAKLRKLLRDVMDWRHDKAQLSGSEKRYDSIMGCFGNPNSKTIFVAEIPEVRGIDEAIHQRNDEQDMRPLWQSNWNVSDGDGLFRMALSENPLSGKKFITHDAENKPLDWNCWITDFVKCPTRTNFWNTMRKEDPEKRDRILSKSAEFLARELEAIQPVNVVMVGRAVDGYFKTFKGKLGVSPETLRYVPHYGRKKGDDQKTKYLADFREGLVSPYP